MKQGMCVALHGGDHKVGVTMLAQCLAEHMVEHLEEMTVIQTGLQGNPGGDYCTAVVRTIEEMKSYLEQFRSALSSRSIVLFALSHSNQVFL